MKPHLLMFILIPLAGAAGCSSKGVGGGVIVGAGGNAAGVGGSAAGVGGGGVSATGGAGGSPGDGSADSPAADGAAGSSGAASCTTLAAALCAKLQSCTPFALAALYGSIETCRDRLMLGCAPTLTAPGTSTTAATVMACAQSLSPLSCATVASGDLGTLCAPHAGALVNGAACGDDAQCASTFCARARDAVCGICAPTTPPGSPCVRGACSTGSVCPMNQSTCIAPVAGQVGATCASVEQCDVANAVGCNTLSGRCIGLTLATAGGGCGADSLLATSYATCPASGTCSAIVNGTCSPAAADGGGCSTAASGPGCLPPARCVAGRCTLANPATCS